MRNRALQLVKSPLLALAVLAGFGCNDTGVRDAPNEPPIIQITDPVPEDDDTPALVPAGQGLTVKAAVDDAEDAPEELHVVWTVERTDFPTAPIELGETSADTTGLATQTVNALEQGVYSVNATVIDSEGAQASAQVAVRFQPTNVAPEVQISQPQQGQEINAGDLTTFTASVSDDGPMSELSIEWYSSLDGVLNTSPPSQTGLLSFSTDELSAGQHDVTLRVTDAQAAWDSDEISFTVIAVNEPPTTPSVNITPSSPDTNSDLTCNASGSADPEGMPVTYIYTWYRNGTALSLPPDTIGIEPEDTTTGDQWICEVRSHDGTQPSALPGADGVVIHNTPPVITGAVITPSPAYEDSVLECVGQSWSDTDLHEEGYLADWYVNGLLVASGVSGAPYPQLTGADFDKGDTVGCILTPYDGYDTGTPQSAADVQIDNSPPTAPEVEVTPGPTAHILADLECTLITASVDADPNDVVTTSVRWLVNGVHDPAYDELLLIPNLDTQLGEEWTCEARGDDGITPGEWGSSTTTIVPNPGDLIVTEFLANPDYVSDPAGEWVEVYNNSGTVMDLRGFELSDADADSHLITGVGAAFDEPLIVPPFARIVLSRNMDFGTNGGVFSPYEYSNFILDDDVDEIIISFQGIEIDRVEYDLTFYPLPLLGRSLGLKPDLAAPDSVLNDDPLNWCAGTSPIGTPGADFGTPGGVNDTCQCWFSDNDGDGYGGDASCTAPDCDDIDPLYNPGAEDVCENGFDENCDGVDAICDCIDTDGDGDGYGDGLGCTDPDCDDTNRFVYPGATEECNDIDDDCNGVVDNGDPTYMCPVVGEVATSECRSGGVCGVASCNGGWFDVDDTFVTGCECEDDNSGSTCSTGELLGAFAAGQTTTVNGRLPLAGLEDWYDIDMSASSRAGSGTPRVELINNPSGAYLIDIFFDCAGHAAGCGSGGTGGEATGVTEYSFTDNQSTGYRSNNTPWPDSIKVRVYRVTSNPVCENYTIEVSR